MELGLEDFSPPFYFICSSWKMFMCLAIFLRKTKCQIASTSIMLKCTIVSCVLMRSEVTSAILPLPIYSEMFLSILNGFKEKNVL